MKKTKEKLFVRLPNKNVVFIYALINPLNDLVFYVGASTYPERRLYDHLNGMNYGESLKNDQLRQISKEGEIPELLILEQCDLKSASYWEEFYIHLFRYYGFSLCQTRTSGYHEGKDKHAKILTTTVKNGLVTASLKHTGQRGITEVATISVPSSEYNSEEIQEILDNEITRRETLRGALLSVDYPILTYTRN